MQKILRIATCVTTCLVVGYLSSLVTKESIATWYSTLIKPPFNPPNWIFAPVWTVLYILIGVSAGMIWNRLEDDEAAVKSAFKLFIFQLALNALWSYLFFGLHNPLLALIEIVLLWLLIWETYTKFKTLDKKAAKLLLPYLGWVSFATILNASIWWLNK
ncbi:TspO/MBR family protein [Flavobacterium sp. XGLA_31]|uniref:TspO/MBR family protein n=1 Tax=Flavobacterium sp. XGLA_31 TaxID=3447666 RepID=UPI003F3F6075